MKIYLLNLYEDRETDTVGFFATREEAEAYINRPGLTYTGYGELTIVEQELGQVDAYVASMFLTDDQIAAENEKAREAKARAELERKERERLRAIEDQRRTVAEAGGDYSHWFPGFSYSFTSSR